MSLSLCSNIPTCGPLSWAITMGYGEKSWSICLCYCTSYACISNCIVFHLIDLLDIPRSATVSVCSIFLSTRGLGAIHPQPRLAVSRGRCLEGESKAGPGGSDSAPPMGGRPCPSASKVTRTRPPREERPCPGRRGRRASWRQRSAQRGGSIAHNAALEAKAGRGTQ